MYNTGNEVPSTALEDMADNAQVFDALVTKTSGTVTDRLGNVRRSFQQIVTDMGFNPVTGSFQAGAIITEYNQCLLDESTGTFYSWSGALPKIISAGSTPSTAGGIGVGTWSDKTDLMLRSELSGGGSLGEAYRVIDVDLPPYSGDLALLITEVTSNTAIKLGVKSYDLSTKPQLPMGVSNISLIGAKMPVYSSDGNSLEGGTVLIGNNDFGVCNGFCMTDIGIDVGPDVIDSIFAGVSQEGLMDIGDDQYFNNVRVLLKSNPAQLKHGIKFEGHNKIVHGYLETRGGYHGYVVKSSNVTGGDVVVRNTSGTTFIMKADNGQTYHDINVNSITYIGDETTAPDGIFESITLGTLSNAHIGMYKAHKVGSGLRFTKDGSAGALSDISIDRLDIYDSTLNGFSLDNDLIGRVSIGTHSLKNCGGQGFYIDGGHSVNIGSGEVVNATQNGYNFGGNISRENLQFGSIRADGCGGWGVKNDALVTINPQMVKGSSNTSGLVSANYGIITVALGTGWSDDFFAHRVTKSGRVVTISGLVLSAKTGNVIMTLPSYLRPSVTEIFSCQVAAPVTPAAGKVVRVFVQSDTGQVFIDPTAVSGVDSVCLSGISYISAF